MSTATRTFQASFNGGELSPLLDSRPDAAVYKDGCRILENFMIRPYGGAFKRPGLQYGGSVKTPSGKTRLMPFKRSTATNYILELGGGYARFWKGGASMARIESGGSAVEVVSPYSEADIFAVQTCQINDVMFSTHPSHPVQRLTRSSETAWSLEESPFDFPPMGDINDTTTSFKIQPGVSKWATATAYAVGGVSLQGGTLYMCLAAHTSGTFATDLAAARWKLVRARGPWVREDDYATADMVDAAGVRYVCIVALTGGNATNIRPGVTAGWASYWKAVGDSGLRIYSSAAAFSAADVGTSFRIDVGSVKRSLFLSSHHSAGDIHTTEPMFIAGDVLVRSTLAAVNAYSGYSTGVAKGDLYLEFSEDGTLFDRVRHWGFKKPTDGNIASTYAGPSTGGYYRLRWEAGASSNTPDQGFFLEAVTGGVTALVKVSSYTSSTEVSATFALPKITFAPSEILNYETRNWYRGAFGPNYPRAIAFHEGRLWLAGVSGDSSRVWGSRVDDYYNFQTGPKDSDGIDITLYTFETNQIEWMSSLGRNLVIGTTGEEWTINSGEQDSVLTPDNLRARIATRNGSTAMAPQMVSDALLWMTRTARRVHEFGYDFSRDSWSGNDVSQLAEHIGRTGFTDADFASNPDPVLWVINASGELAGFTYDRKQSVTAWHRHVTDGAFESVASIYGDDGDEVWLVVRRTISGASVRYIERFYPRAQSFDFDTAADLFYVDSGVKTTPSGAVITGLGHLEGKTVKILANGSRVEQKVVSSGSVTLSASASSAIVGLPYSAIVQPMRLEVMLDDGTGQGRRWRPNRLVACLFKSMLGQFSPDGQSWASFDYTTPAEREVGDSASLSVRTARIKEHISADWEDSIDLQIKSSDPCPFNLLAYILIHEVEGR